MRYGKLVEGKLVPIPTTVADARGVWRVARTLAVEEAEAIGYKPVFEDEPAGMKDDEYAVPTGWEESDLWIRRTWRIEKLQGVVE